jgi:hypothetical protein
MNFIRAKSNGPPEAACTIPARGLSAKGNRSRSGRTRFEAEHEPLAKRGLGAKRQQLLPRLRQRTNQGRRKNRFVSGHDFTACGKSICEGPGRTSLTQPYGFGAYPPHSRGVCQFDPLPMMFASAQAKPISIARWLFPIALKTSWVSSGPPSPGGAAQAGVVV